MKYIIDIPKTVGMLEAVGSVHYTYFDGIQCQTIILKSDEIEELNSDYINEHYGVLQDEAYQRGVEDGRNETWEAVKKISLMSPDEIEKVFPGAAKYNRYNLGYSGVEAIEKLKAYEEKQNDKIEVGDEVNWLGDCFIVTRIFQPHNMKEQCDGIDDDGCVYHDVLMDDLEKTGKHIDITSILEDMRND